jgi:hypothetical protein
MVKVNLSDKDFAERKPYFDVGVHEVFITEATKVAPETGAPYIEVTVIGQNDETDNLRLYISEAAAPYTLANLARIAVHNAKDDAAKDKVREAFKKIDDTDLIDEKFLAKFKDMQAWILTKEDTTGQQKPNGGFYLRSQLYSWEPKAEPSDINKDIENGKPIDVSEIPF